MRKLLSLLLITILLFICLPCFATTGNADATFAKNQKSDISLCIVRK